MRIALSEAVSAKQRGDVPVGACLVCDGRIVAIGGNTRWSQGCAVLHAELIVLQKAAGLIREPVAELTLYCTLEPCLMCLGAVILGGVDRIVYGCGDPYGGAASLDMKISRPFYAPRWPKIMGGVLGQSCYDLLLDYLTQTEIEGYLPMKAAFQDTTAIRR